MAKSSQSMRDKIRNNSKENISRDAKYINKPDGIGFLTVPTGDKIKLNILPYEVSMDKHPDKIEAGDSWYKLPYLLHRNVGAEEAAVICPRTIGKSCPICERKNEVANSKDPDKDLIKALTPSRRCLYFVEAVGDKKLSGTFLFDISYFAFQKLLDKELTDEDNEKYLGFADAVGGFTLAVRFDEETAGGYKFPKASSIKFLERDDISAKLIKTVPCLDDCLNILSAKEITKLLNDLDDDDIVDDDEPEEKPKKKAPVEDDEEESPKAKKKVVEDDDEEPAPKKKVKEEEPEEEDDEPTPKKKRAVEEDDDEPPAKKKKVVEEDDDEPPAKPKKKAPVDDDDEPPMKRGRPKKEEDDEPPKKSTAKGGKCPSGYEWGDASKKKTTHDECEDCSVWKSCTKA
jgi:hypothetical protein